MHWKRPIRRNLFVALGVLMAVTWMTAGCQRSKVKEAPITGKATDPLTSMPVLWQGGKRYLYRVDVGTSSIVPRRNTGKPIRADTTLGMDLAFSVTNSTSGDYRVVDMKVLAVQMEMSHDGGTILTFDSDNKTIPVEENPLADRLQRLVGASLRFILSPANKVTRVDAMKDFNDRMSTGGNSVRGVGADVLRRFFNQQFFRDLLEMGMFRQDPTRIGESWKETRAGNAGLWGTGAPLELEFKFRGWQRRDGTNCARLDFTGKFQPTPFSSLLPGGAGSNQPPPRVANRGNPPNEEGTITGQVWYNPELSLGVELVYDQSMTKRSTPVVRGNIIRKAGGPGGTNQPNRAPPSQPPPPGGQPNPEAATPPPPNMVVRAMTNPPGGPPGTNVAMAAATTSQWHVTFKLLEIEALPVDKAVPEPSASDKPAAEGAAAAKSEGDK